MPLGGNGFNVRKKHALQLFKTDLCVFYLKGKCLNGERCTYAHDNTEMREKPDLTRTSMCKEFLQSGTCSNPRCRFAHTEDELRSTNGFFKMKMCGFVRDGRCKYGSLCRFAHTKDELRCSQSQFVHKARPQAAAAELRPKLAPAGATTAPAAAPLPPAPALEPEDLCPPPPSPSSTVARGRAMVEQAVAAAAEGAEEKPWDPQLGFKPRKASSTTRGPSADGTTGPDGSERRWANMLSDDEDSDSDGSFWGAMTAGLASALASGTGSSGRASAGATGGSAVAGGTPPQRRSPEQRAPRPAAQTAAGPDGGPWQHHRAQRGDAASWGGGGAPQQPSQAPPTMLAQYLGLDPHPPGSVAAGRAARRQRALAERQARPEASWQDQGAPSRRLRRQLRVQAAAVMGGPAAGGPFANGWSEQPLGPGDGSGLAAAPWPGAAMMAAWPSAEQPMVAMAPWAMEEVPMALPTYEAAQFWQPAEGAGGVGGHGAGHAAVRGGMEAGEAMLQCNGGGGAPRFAAAGNTGYSLWGHNAAGEAVNTQLGPCEGQAPGQWAPAVSLVPWPPNNDEVYSD